MNQELLVEHLFQTVVSGDRHGARTISAHALEQGITAEEVTLRLYWPTLEMVNQLFRKDQLNVLGHHYATRVLRSLIDQAQSLYQQKAPRNKSICLFSGPSETEELAGQMMADLAEADGYTVYFAGGGVAADEILEEASRRNTDILLLFASAPSDAPGIRQLIDTVREIGSCPDMQIVVGGGVFNRAEGLAEEIGADLWASDPEEILDELRLCPERRATPDQRTVGRSRRAAA
ncbi:MAG: cobalamin B12-binding domain-containing protein [Phycisphaerales bacterium]